MVTAVLLKWKRRDELDAIVAHLRTFPDLINQILIRDNTKTNMKSYGRYLVFDKAFNDTIYVQDDDCIINNVREIIEAYDGEHIVNGFKKNDRHRYPEKPTMVGWGTVFDKNWTKCLSRYIARYGIDDVLMREADRIFTGLAKQSRIEIDADVEDFPSAREEGIAQYKESDHEEFKQLAYARIKEINTRHDI